MPFGIGKKDKGAKKGSSSNQDAGQQGEYVSPYPQLQSGRSQYVSPYPPLPSNRSTTSPGQVSRTNSGLSSGQRLPSPVRIFAPAPPVDTNQPPSIPVRDADGWAKRDPWGRPVTVPPREGDNAPGGGGVNIADIHSSKAMQDRRATAAAAAQASTAAGAQQRPPAADPASSPGSQQPTRPAYPVRTRSDTERSLYATAGPTSSSAGTYAGYGSSLGQNEEEDLYGHSDDERDGGDHRRRRRQR
ncbi:hypothetical protein PRZ48_008848 [Zasmidium cellare]|uniref:Uncharacterized protein n=1 Tax=Zasmidium cellare TaxID=395010 RepID=A0ABR0EGM1_ZASCE|nr:hypothetical protein PRZ48_008848 [Zasmidium cellare]